MRQAAVKKQAASVADKAKSDGLDLPAETKSIDPLPPHVELEEHEAAALFPMLAGGEAEDFNADIRAHGVAVPVTLIEVDGKRLMLDGRNRRRAARLAGQSCPAELYVGATPVRFVIAHNLRRRHLNESQRSALAAGLANFTHGGKRFGAAKGEGEAAEPAISRDEAAAMTGASVRSVARAAKVMKKAPDLFNAVQTGKIAVSVALQAVDLSAGDQQRVIEEISAGRAKTATQVVKRGRVKIRNDKLKAKILADPTRKYAVIVSDDEWAHLTWSESGQDRAAVMHYSVSEAETLKARQLPAADNAVYYMWSTVPHLPLALDLMQHRGFQYRSQFIWWKIYPGNKPGLGYWARIEHEILLIGTRGDIACPAPGDNWRSVQMSYVGEHSQKPEWAFRMIESYHRDLAGTMIELNARRRRRGWSAWGNEIGLLEPPHAELEREFSETPQLPDSDYIELDRSQFQRPIAAAKAAAKKITASPAAALEALVAVAGPDEEPPENPELRVLWNIERGAVGSNGGGVASVDLQRAIAAGHVTPGRANRKRSNTRPPLVSAHGEAEIAAWRKRMAEEAEFEAAAPVAEEAENPLPAFMAVDSAERQVVTKKRDGKRGAA